MGPAIASPAIALATEGSQSTDALKSWTLPGTWKILLATGLDHFSLSHGWTTAEPWKAQIQADRHAPGSGMAFASEADFRAWAEQVMAPYIPGAGSARR